MKAGGRSHKPKLTLARAWFHISGVRVGEDTDGRLWILEGFSARLAQASWFNREMRKGLIVEVPPKFVERLRRVYDRPIREQVGIAVAAAAEKGGGRRK